MHRDEPAAAVTLAAASRDGSIAPPSTADVARTETAADEAPPPGEAAPLDEAAARDAVRRRPGVEPVTVARFPTGARHVVHEVTLPGGERVVARLSRPGDRDAARGALHWNRELRPRGVPLPAVLAAAVEPGEARFPTLILERLPGTDLQHVHPWLTPAERTAVARRLAAAQRVVGTLPPAPGYGYAVSPDDPGLLGWCRGVVEGGVAQSLRRIAAAGLVDPRHADRVARAVERHALALEAVPPTPFLDDTTTKNVLVHHGRLSGIVDVDDVGYGDPLSVVALTRTALLARGWDTGYVDAWLADLDRHADPAPERAARLDLYTAGFCLGFLGELGQRFNRDAPAPADPAHVARLEAILDEMPAGLDGGRAPGADRAGARVGV